jgi:hypothetical protein
LQEKKLEEKDEALIKSIFHVSTFILLSLSSSHFCWWIFVCNLVYFFKNLLQNSKDYVRRIHNEDFDDDRDMIQLSSGNGETSCDQPKV